MSEDALFCNFEPIMLLNEISSKLKSACQVLLATSVYSQ